MTEITADALWQYIIAHSKEAFEGMFQDTTLTVSEEGRKIIFCFPNQFSFELFRDNHKSRVREIMEEYLDGQVTIELVRGSPRPEATREKSLPTPDGKSIIPEGLKSRDPPHHPSPHNPYPLKLLRGNTFENFVVKAGNLVAYSIISSLVDGIQDNTETQEETFSDPTQDDGIAADMPLPTNNRILIVGGVSHGKTHLLQAAAHHARKKMRDGIIYITADKFVGGFVSAVTRIGREKDRKEKDDFDKAFRGAKILLIDDLHTLAEGNKVASQREFMAILDDLETEGAIVICASAHPIANLSLRPELKSRLAKLTMIPIEKPDFALRTAIVKKKAELKRLPLTELHAEMIAERQNPDDLRSLEGALDSLNVQYRALSLPLETLIKRLFGERPLESNYCTIAAIKEAVAAHFGISPDELLRRSRKEEFLKPRHIALYLCQSLLEISASAIGQAFEQDRSTVLNAVERIKRDLEEDPKLKDAVEGITKTLPTHKKE